ncbi:hypothetical protein ACJZ2D_014947 [Fusarium nematophilum]
MTDYREEGMRESIEAAHLDTTTNSTGRQITEFGLNDDDGYDSEQDSMSTTSAISQFTKYDYKHGRRYHANNQGRFYLWPNDDKQNETLELLHHADTLALNGKLHLAPIKDNIQSVLDIGTGTGIWAIEFADDHPGAHVIGVDISPIQPVWVPTNLDFQLDDCNEDWNYRERFDFIHVRRMCGSIKDWSAFFKQASESLKPGGYIESHEVSMRFECDDETIRPGSPQEKWWELFKAAGDKMERSFTIAEDDTLRKSMEENGFTNIKEYPSKIPVGRWPKDEQRKEIGRFVLAASYNDLEGFLLRPAIELLGWSQEEVFIFAAVLRKELRSGRAHSYFKRKVIVGQKPL